MSVLLLSRVFPPEIGGSGRWLWELYSRFAEGECLVVSRESKEAAAFDSTHQLQIVRLGMPNGLWGFLDWKGSATYCQLYRELSPIVRTSGADQIHVACVLPEGLLAWMLRRRLGLPYSVYVHGEELNIVSKSRELSWMARRVFRSADRVIANSQNTAELLRQEWPVDDGRLHVLRPGVDTSVYIPGERCSEVRMKLGWGDRPVVLTVGRLQARKGQDKFIEAILRIRDSNPDILYSIVGDGSDRSRLSGLVDDFDLRDHVIFQGAVGDNDLVEAYQQCDLFALPNRDVDGDIEGFGLVLLEAQACGKPVLTGDSGGTRETLEVGVSGMVVDCRDPVGIANAVVGLLQDRTRLDTMGEAGRDWVVRNFDWQVCVNRARQVFGLNAFEPQLVGSQG
jgi:phosphatidylinositol alpha-1,6-mannosyltransferase